MGKDGKLEEFREMETCIAPPLRIRLGKELLRRERAMRLER